MKKIKKVGKSIIGVLASIVFVVAMAPAVLAGSAVVSWDANTEPDLAGYRLYYDTTSHAGTCPTGYGVPVEVTNGTQHAFDNLTVGQTYYFQLTAYDTSDNESGCCTNPGEVSKLITYRGDINETPDHAVNINDFTLLAADYGRTSWCGPTHKTDINRDCTVNINDFTLLAAEYGLSF